jgi:hypothetical protein
VVLKSLGCLNGDKINIQNEVGRKMGCGVGDPPNGKNFKKSFLVDVYQRLTQIIVWKYLCFILKNRFRGVERDMYKEQ